MIELDPFSGFAAPRERIITPERRRQIIWLMVISCAVAEVVLGATIVALVWSAP